MTASWHGPDAVPALRTALVRLAAAARGSRLVDDLVRYHPWHYPRTRWLCRDYARRDAAGRAALRQDMVQRALAWADGTPYGAACRRPSRLAGWPLLEKSQLRDHPAAFRRAMAVAMPASTGGTSGLPLRLWRSLRCVAAERAFLDHHLAVCAGASFRAPRIAVLRGDDVKAPGDRRPPFGRFALGGRRLLLSAQHLGPGTIAWYADTLRAYAPDMLWIYPSAGEALVRLLQRAGHDLRLPLVLSSSELLTPAARRCIAEVLQARVIDYYGLAERVALAVSAEAESYRFDPLYGTVELEPVAAPAGAGFATAEIIATAHFNEAMPLVRYRTGDRILCPADCGAAGLAAIAAGERSFPGVLGRAGDYLVSPRGEVLVGIDHLPRETAHVLRLQIVQQRFDAVEVRVVGSPGFGPADRQQLEHNIRRKIPDDMTVSIVETERLQRTPAGKAPFVIRAPHVRPELAGGAAPARSGALVP